ncbi:protein SODIUM POTASSIUM ROOT DEFECTIVE 1 [Heracleum sosnowskyi]|uniref:Protein SODIUM POTASSIUM ROOT DEFECTIVE 1 n=1 Tax=Heracleum sosnowskyi TaxID=360622 RepID=A0AAD8HVN7_9APIA|nr:protein SODIUM POTASSIUM ROOT DEFECTIVE 1 [Heracleum sosnowskyi]
MKSIDFLCASPASTAIRSSTDRRAMVRNDHGTRSMDRRSNHYISDHHRRKSKDDIPAIPCSPQLPKNRKSTSDFRFMFASQSNREVRRRGSAEIINDLTSTPHGSSRHLLSDKTLSEVLQQTDSLFASDPSEPVMTRSQSSKGPMITRSLSSNDSALVSNHQASRPCGLPISTNDSLVSNSINRELVASQSVGKDESSVLKSSAAPSKSRNQVVELMVSIHCKGCEGKVRKHISKIEGVTSFSIDRATKKVTVIGEVTPLGVLSSISKVKNAQLWPSPTSSAS